MPPNPEFPSGTESQKQGMAVLRVVLDKQSGIGSIAVEDGGPQFQIASLSVLWHREFGPATLGSQPVYCEVNLQLTFQRYNWQKRRLYSCLLSRNVKSG